jgi:RNA polymerase sigma-70 factor (ECF subfamily)
MAYRHEYALLTDQELIGLFQNGEAHGAFTAIVERYQQKIYLAARRMVGGDHDAADELAQDTFVKAYGALAKFRGDSQLYTWLYRIMMNASIQQSRQVKKRQHVSTDDVQHVLEAEGCTPVDSMERSETTRLIEQAIETLPPKQRQVFLMRFYDELSYDDIAAIVGTSVGGLKANYFHAVKKIGEYLKAAGVVSGLSGEESELSESSQ